MKSGSATKYDVAIIGAGVAGGMAAMSLASSGLKVILLEKMVLPRHKSCGGAMPYSVNAYFHTRPPIEHTVSRIRTQFDYQQELVSPSEPVWLANRADFDGWLVQQALHESNGSLTLGENFDLTDIQEKADHVLISGKRCARIIANYLIAADGATGKSAALLDLNRDRANAIAIDAEVQVTAAAYAACSDHMLFNYFCVPHGYGWVFPKRAGVLSCGIGTWQGRINLRRGMHAFLDKSIGLENVQSVDYYGHPIPAYAGQRTIATRRICLTGDAASLTDPVIGEGIRFALESGHIAASVIAHLHGITIRQHVEYEIPDSAEHDCRLYQRMIERYLTGTLEFQHRFAALAYLKAPEFFYRRYVVNN